MNEQNICRREDSPRAYRPHEPAGAAATLDTDSSLKDRNEPAYHSGGAIGVGTPYSFSPSLTDGCPLPVPLMPFGHVCVFNATSCKDTSNAGLGCAMISFNSASQRPCLHSTATFESGIHPQFSSLQGPLESLVSSPC